MLLNDGKKWGLTIYKSFVLNMNNYVKITYYKSFNDNERLYVH